MNDYPFLDKIRIELEAKGQRLIWLASQIGKSERWFYNIKSIEDLSLREIDKISSLLEKNFMIDYNIWRVQNDQPALHLLGEPETPYQVVTKRIHVQLKLSAPTHLAEENMSRMLMTIRREGEKLGFDIE